MDNANWDRRRFLGGAALTASAAALAPNLSAATAAKPAGAKAPLADVAGKVAFITGASSGIGLGQARVLHAAGMKVALGYIRDDQRAEAEALFSEGRDRVQFVRADVTDRAQMKTALDEVEARFGRLHLVSANAGVGMGASVANASHTDFDWCFAVNVTGVFNTIHECLPRLRRHAEGGHIVATSSMNGILPVANGGTGVYTASKFAVTGMMEALRAELDALGDNIGVSVFCPGFVSTRIGEVDGNRSGSYAGTRAEGGRAPTVRGAPPRVPGQPIPGMDPIEAGEYVLAAIRRNQLFILSHPEFRDGIRERNDCVLASVSKATPPAERVAFSVANTRNPLYVEEMGRL